MTEKTENTDWFSIAFAILIAPVLASNLLFLPAMILPPLALRVLPVAIVSLYVGYVSYLVLAGPLMALAHWCGLDHPVLHGLIGYGAIWLIPTAHAAGLPYAAAPDTASIGQLFAPLWCATSAAIYLMLRSVRTSDQVSTIKAETA